MMVIRWPGPHTADLVHAFSGPEQACISVQFAPDARGWD